MPRPQTKPDLLAAAAQGYDELSAFMESMTDKELETPFDFTRMKAKSEAHWARDKNLRAGLPTGRGTAVGWRTAVGRKKAFRIQAVSSGPL